MYDLNTQIDYKDYYREMWEKGLEFQDFVMELLRHNGITFQPYMSKKKQCERGENTAGFEIKLDRKFKQTGRLYIETHEKSHPSKPFWTPSGINRDDNTWLYLIGDQTQVFCFGKKNLVDIEPKMEKKQIKTSKGFVMPIEDAYRIALRIFFPNTGVLA